jgi:ribosome-associated translation inhibitor RaiA
MVEKEITIADGKNIKLMGFEELKQDEIESIQRIIAPYIEKINLIQEYQLLKISLKKHPKSKITMNELRASMQVKGKIFGVETDNKNLYKAMATLMEKLISEINHFSKK